MSISFIYPQYLWFLLIMPVVVSLGLWNKRRTNSFRYWSGMVLRVVIFLCIIFALASVQLNLPADILTTVFVLDSSDSINPIDRTRGEGFILKSIERMSERDQAAIVVFGKDALVERLASSDPQLTDLSSIPVTTQTNIAGALQLAQAIFPYEGAKRIVLLSDGRENLGLALEQTQIAASNGIELTFFPLGSNTDFAEVLLESLESPSYSRKGERIYLKVAVHSTISTGAILRLFLNGDIFLTAEVDLIQGTNRFQFEVDPQGQVLETATANSFLRFRALIIPDNDNRLQNNEAYAFTIIQGPPEILLVEGMPGDGQNLEQALKSSEMQIVRVPARDMPRTLLDLANYQAVILVDVPANNLPIGVLDILPVYVRELGRGLVMVGGPNTFGAGGYLRTSLEEALPVSMDIKNRQLQANLALVMAVDKSGSMGRCHCDDPNLNQSYSRVEAGQPKVDIAKEAVMRAASALGDSDYLGVVTFDGSAHWAVRVMPLIDPIDLERSLASFQAEGSTNMETGVTAALGALEGIPAQRKHIILLTDGWVRQGDLNDLANEMDEKGITLSVIAAGEGSAEYLATLAEIGGGRYYPATDMLKIPEIFLKETIESVGQYIIEETFYPIPGAPSPILRGIDTDDFPPLLGYNGTTSKNTARLDLITARGDPLLASWQYGIGRSAAWTSDLKGQWAKEWLEWEDFAALTSQLVAWVLPAPRVEGFDAAVRYQDGEAIIDILAVDRSGIPINLLEGAVTIISPMLDSSTVPVRQVGAGQYRAKKEIDTPGTYLIRIGMNQGDQSKGQISLGLAVPYSPEYRASGVNRSLMTVLAEITGGGEISEPSESFIHNLKSIESAREIWYPLLLIAALLFPLEIAVRRVVINFSEFQHLVESLKSKISRSEKETAHQRQILTPLFKARERARTRQSPESEKIFRPLPTEQSLETSPTTGIENEEKPATSEPDSSDSIARLQAAKKRARKDRDQFMQKKTNIDDDQ